MIDYDNQVVSALKTVLPTYYELALTSKTNTPCISFQELNNYSISEHLGSTLGYSYITYQVKIWDVDMANIKKYALDVDAVMRTLGFKRISSGELHDHNSAMIQKILTYEALASENY